MVQRSETTFEVTEQGDALGLFSELDINKTILFLEPQTIVFLAQHLEKVIIKNKPHIK